MSREAMQIALDALEANLGNWAAKTKAVEVLRQALETEQQEPVAIKWTLDGDKTCRYNNWLGETPFGRILITWKGWKEYHDACVDEFPGGFNAYGSADEVKEMCETEFAKRSGDTSLPPRKPWGGLTNEELMALLDCTHHQSRWTLMERVESTLKEKNT